MNVCNSFAYVVDGCLVLTGSKFHPSLALVPYFAPLTCLFCLSVLIWEWTVCELFIIFPHVHHIPSCVAILISVSFFCFLLAIILFNSQWVPWLLCIYVCHIIGLCQPWLMLPDWFFISTGCKCPMPILACLIHESDQLILLLVWYYLRCQQCVSSYISQFVYLYHYSTRSDMTFLFCVCIINRGWVLSLFHCRNFYVAEKIFSDFLPLCGFCYFPSVCELPIFIFLWMPNILSGH